MNINIRRLYLYITSFIGLILIIIGTVGLVNIALKTWVLTRADDTDLRYLCERPVAAPDKEVTSETLSEEDCEKRMDEEKTARRQKDAAQDIAMIIVGTPVWLYHWSRIKNEKDA
jgi:hypothetical protein